MSAVRRVGEGEAGRVGKTSFGKFLGMERWGFGGGWDRLPQCTPAGFISQIVKHERNGECKVSASTEAGEGNPAGVEPEFVCMGCQINQCIRSIFHAYAEWVFRGQPVFDRDKYSLCAGDHRGCPPRVIRPRA